MYVTIFSVKKIQRKRRALLHQLLAQARLLIMGLLP
jgi:hypothetical protein